MIGILGGAGPTAGTNILNEIIEETIADTDQGHLPVILLSFPGNIPDRTTYLMGKEKTNPAKVITNIFLQLENAGATVAAIPCNTAHAPQIFNKVLNTLKSCNSHLVVLNMVEETVNYIKENYKVSSVGVLSTIGTSEMGIYRKALQAKGFNVIEPNAAMRKEVHEAIYNQQYGVKAYPTFVKPQSIATLLAAVDDLIERGAEIIILGCSEIPLAIKDSAIKDIPLINPNKILARALIKNFDASKLKEKLK